MTPGTFRFEDYCLDTGDRRLSRDGAPGEINAGYFDALALLVREAGRLVSKDRFMGEVWRGIPVTDEALTQCIRTLRRELGDDAAAPRFIETVPKHGYRFIAPVEQGRHAATARPRDWGRILTLGLAGTAGGGGAGIIGGLLYGFAAAGQSGAGAISGVLVIVAITTLVALLGAAGVAFAIALAGLGPHRPPQWTITGAALGGLIVGAIDKLLGLDAYNLLLGHAPTAITGPFEGVLIGAAVGLGAWLADGKSVRRGVAIAALAGAAAGLVIPVLGGRLMGGSLVSLAAAFPESRLRLDRIGGVFGESGFGPVSQAVTGALEVGLFSACVVGAMMLARRARDNPRNPAAAAGRDRA
jgi:DNA-binding winged helix-turn-helix (wHTH) protein